MGGGLKRIEAEPILLTAPARRVFSSKPQALCQSRYAATTERKIALNALASTASDRLLVIGSDRRCVAWIQLIYGNGRGLDVINCFSNNDLALNLVGPAQEWASTIKYGFSTKADQVQDRSQDVVVVATGSGDQPDQSESVAKSSPHSDEDADVAVKHLRLARLNKLFIIRAAVEDIVANDLRISTSEVDLTDNVAEIMCSVAAHDLAVVLAISTLGGEKIGDVHLEDGDDHEVFGQWEKSLEDELDRAFGLINEVNDDGGYLGDRWFH